MRDYLVKNGYVQCFPDVNIWRKVFSDKKAVIVDVSYIFLNKTYDGCLHISMGFEVVLIDLPDMSKKVFGYESNAIEYLIKKT